MKPETLTDAVETVSCPLCQEKMRMISNKHLAIHGLDTQSFKKRFPGSRRLPLEMAKRRSLKASATLKSRPESIAILRATGKRLAEYRRGLPTELNSTIQSKSAATFMSRIPPAKRIENGRRGGLIAHAKNPNLIDFALKSRGGQDNRKFWSSEEGRAYRGTLSKDMWTKDSHRENVASKNRAHAISGRIPVRFPHIRPTRAEKAFINVIERHHLPLDYTGDGRFRIVIPPGGKRHWRNPDFVIRGQKKVVLLDGYFKEVKEETRDYVRAGGWKILRVSVPELFDEEWVVRKVMRYVNQK